MKLAHPYRTQIVAVLIVLGVLCGGLCGYMVGLALVKRSAYAALDRDAVNFQARINLLISDVYEELQFLNRSPYPPCSPEELFWLRARIYRDGMFHDAGRMQNGKFECSATFDVHQLPTTAIKPRAVQNDGVAIYSNIAPYADARGKVVLHQFGKFYVIPDPTWVFAIRGMIGHVERDIIDPIHGPVRADGSPSGVPWVPKDRSGRGQRGDTLYVAHFVRNLDSCFVAWGSYSTALVAARHELWLDALVGGLIALTILLFLAFLWVRNSSGNYLVKRAIRAGRIRMAYQPIVDLKTLRVVGAEALARLSDAASIASRPDVFVKIAERQDLVCALTQRVFECCLKDFGEELRAHPDFRLNINITAADLAEPRFLSTLERRLTEEKIPSRSLALEITETSTASTAVAIDAIHKLAARGHSVQIDDFGTGYSSLSYLRDLRVDTIKIDKSFTHTIGTGAVTEKLVPQIMAMADALEMHLTVEGIETAEQLHYFQAMDRPLHGQGWLFGRAVGPAEFKRLYLERPDRVLFRFGDSDGGAPGKSAQETPAKAEAQSSSGGLEFTAVAENARSIRAFS